MPYELLPVSRYADDERCQWNTRRGACARSWQVRHCDGCALVVCRQHRRSEHPVPERTT
jgi:hypothetical protein